MLALYLMLPWWCFTCESKRTLCTTVRYPVVNSFHMETSCDQGISHGYNAYDWLPVLPYPHLYFLKSSLLLCAERRYFILSPGEGMPRWENWIGYYGTPPSPVMSSYQQVSGRHWDTGIYDAYYHLVGLTVTKTVREVNTWTNAALVIITALVSVKAVCVHSF